MVTVKFPVDAGVQRRVGLSAEMHPCGSPMYEYVNGAVPPFTTIEKVVELPTTMVDGVAEADTNVIADPTSRYTVALTDAPEESVAVMLTEKFPDSAGLQVRAGTLVEVHPSGNPEYEYVTGLAPPDTEIEKTADAPTMTKEGETEADTNVNVDPTSKDANATILLPAESATMISTVKVPVVVGMHLRDATLLDVHPGGSPE
jgi:hypothetical protein